MDRDLCGKTIVMIGCGLIGSEFAKALLKNRSKLLVIDYSSESIERLKESLSLEHKSCLYTTVADVSKLGVMDEVMSEYHKELGVIDTVIVAAYPKASGYGDKFEHIKVENFEKNINAHLKLYFMITQYFCKYFTKQESGNIILLSSIYSFFPPRFEIYEQTNMTMPLEYAMVKAAINQMVKYCVAYYANSNIRVNCLSPGGVLNNQDQNFVQNYNKHGKSKGMLNVEDLIGPILFLVSNDSQYINGQNIICDDGWTV